MSDGGSWTFLSTLPARGATLEAVRAAIRTTISIHAPREGSDPCHYAGWYGHRYFYPRSPRGERRRDFQVWPRQVPISIHAPREGSDGRSRGVRRNHENFYPRSPRGERPAYSITVSALSLFLSTLPARGATKLPRIPGRAAEISIHAPREGSDTQNTAQTGNHANFYPRSPRGERRSDARRTRPQRQDFYPRSPRGERHLISGIIVFCINFYPRSPRGERRSCLWQIVLTEIFLSTLPARGATCGGHGRRRVLLQISIHAPREGSDM